MRNLIDIPPSSQTGDKVSGHTGQSSKHESAIKHVSGNAIYIDDIPEAKNMLHAAVGRSSIAAGAITSINLDAVKKAPGVIAVITHKDVPGELDIGPVFPGDLMFAIDEIVHFGQPIFAVSATDITLARQAVLLADITYDENTPILTEEQALDTKSFVRPTHSHQRGDATRALKNAKLTLSGSQHIGGQEHFYLEGQVAIALPTEDGGMHVHSSSQHPTEVQKLVAEVLHTPINHITVETRRMGGGFGGKETQAAPWACIASVLAHHTKRPVKLRLPRADDMIMTGKRHEFYNTYDVGFDESGLLRAAKITVNGRCGHSPDLSDAIVDRAMFHSDNAYFLENALVIGNRCRTNTVSNTAYRGFGGPQGMMIIEQIMDDVARSVGKDPLDVRKLNLYKEGRDTTHYHQKVETETLPLLIEQLESTSDYRQRREQITSFNRENKILKKGIALTPVKFGISFTVQHLNQAGALVHIYTDGSVHLNHGGTEMGQGLFTKVAQIVAEEFQIPLAQVQVSATRTDKVPNTSPTAASSGTDLNGKAAQNAAKILKQRLIDFLVETETLDSPKQVHFHDGKVTFGRIGEEQALTFAELAQKAYLGRVSLSSTGYYKTPKIWYDRENAKGRPFFYFANGAAVSEVLIDTLTGEYKVLRADVLHDVGRSLNPEIDIGQIEGAFIQGMGWLTTEELKWDTKGRLMTTGPATYKIPAIGDTPPVFNVDLLKNSPNAEATIYHSKAVGEPPFMLAISVWSALRDAISSLSDYRVSPPLDTPATPERVLNAVEALKAQSS